MMLDRSKKGLLQMPWNSTTASLILNGTCDKRAHGGGEVLMSCVPVVVQPVDPRIPTNAGTEHVGFSPTRQTFLALIAKRREVLT